MRAFQANNYTGTTDLAVQESLSPTKLVKPPSQFSFKPTLLIDTQGDSIPYNQILDMQSAFIASGVPVTSYRLITILHSSAHAFEYWDDLDNGTPSKLISQEVMDYVKPVIGPF